jgi:hypothetical protein
MIVMKAARLGYLEGYVGETHRCFLIWKKQMVDETEEDEETKDRALEDASD